MRQEDEVISCATKGFGWGCGLYLGVLTGSMIPFAVIAVLLAVVFVCCGGFGAAYDKLEGKDAQKVKKAK